MALTESYQYVMYPGFFKGPNIEYDPRADIILTDPADGAVIPTGTCGDFEFTFVSLDKRAGSSFAARGWVELRDLLALPTEPLSKLHCCDTVNINDYGFYDFLFTSKLIDYVNGPTHTLSFEVEIVPDCTQHTISKRAGEPDYHEIVAYVNYPLSTDTLDLSNTFTHSLEGHYNDYCGFLSVELPASTTSAEPYLSIDATTHIVTSAPTAVSDIRYDVASNDIYVRLPAWDTYHDATFALLTRVLPWCEAG